MIRRALRRLCVWAFAAIAGLMLVVAASIVMMRWVAPPTTAFMLLADRPVNAQWVPIEAIAASVQRAVVISEDQRFYDHRGVDVQAIRQALDEYATGEGLRGASTITQQVAKNLYLTPSRSLFRKALEAGLAVLIEIFWTKRRILEVYLNIAQFDTAVFGAEAAAKHYFGKPALELSDAEAALLAASLPSPESSNPARPSAYLRQRQVWILEQM